MKKIPKVLGVILFLIGVFWFISIIVTQQTKNTSWNNFSLISWLTLMVGLLLGGNFIWWKDQKMTGVEFLIWLVICLIMAIGYLSKSLLH